MAFDKPLGYYIQQGYPFHFHVLDVGEGLMALLVFPDETTILYDCNVREKYKDSILEYLGRYIPTRFDSEIGERRQWIDIFVNSHRDLDHYRGLSEVNSYFPIKSIWDSGQSGSATSDSHYQYYMRLRRTLIDKYGKTAVVIPAPSLSPLRTFGGAQIYCLCSSQEFIQKGGAILLEAARVQHTNAIVLSIWYAGRSLLLTSDSDWKAWKEDIVPNFGKSGLLKTTILQASHHGSRSFFTDETENESIDPEENPDTTYLDSIEYISPSITLIPCGPYDEKHHPNIEALAIYKKHTAKEQVYTTHSKGTFVGFLEPQGHWTVVPSRFSPVHSKQNSMTFDVTCKCSTSGSSRYLNSNSNIPIDSTVEFAISPHGGIADPYLKVKVFWEVSNGGVNDHHDCQEIYFKGVKEAGDKLHFNRDVVYEGKHLLRCRLINKAKGVDLTRIFVVNGVKP